MRSTSSKRQAVSDSAERKRSRQTGGENPSPLAARGASVIQIISAGLGGTWRQSWGITAGSRLGGRRASRHLPRAVAVEGATAAGPIGGSDIRSVILPSPGFYGGVVGLYNNVTQFHDGTGHPAPALNAVGLTNDIAGAFFLYVPDFKLFDGRIGLAGVVAGDKIATSSSRRCRDAAPEQASAIPISNSPGHVLSGSCDRQQ